MRSRPAALAVARTVPVLVCATVLMQICYPLLGGRARNVLTVLVVATAAAASLVAVAVTRGRRAVAVVAVLTAGLGFAVEVAGVHTGVPFGAYRYAGSLGPRAFGVPLVIPLAWTMLAWPAALVACRVTRSLLGRVVVGAWALASWDVFLDPQMVAAGHWRWTVRGAVLPGVPDVPLSNFLGWLAVAAVISVGLQLLVLPGYRGHPDDHWLLGFWIWTWLSSTMALAVFLHLPAAAAWGFLAMGAVGIPLLLRLRLSSGVRTLAARRSRKPVDA